MPTFSCCAFCRKAGPTPHSTARFLISAPMRRAPKARKRLPFSGTGRFWPADPANLELAGSAWLDFIAAKAGLVTGSGGFKVPATDTQEAAVALLVAPMRL